VDVLPLLRRTRNMDEEHNNSENPTLESRVGRLEVQMAETCNDIKWIKMLVAPTFLVSVISLLLLIVHYTKL